MPDTPAVVQDRDAALAAFVASAGWPGAERIPLAGDKTLVERRRNDRSGHTSLHCLLDGPTTFAGWLPS